MSISIKRPAEIEAMRRAGRIVHRALEHCRQAVRPGITTEQLDAIALQTWQEAGARGLFKNYPTYEPGKGFPGNTCISINEEVVHGIPGSRELKPGDLVSIDCGIILDGWCGDAAITVAVGEAEPRLQRLIDVTQQTLDLAINRVRPGVRWSDIAREMQRHVESSGYSCVREFVGHGIGRRLHEDPKVPNFTSPDFERRGDFYLQAGMTLAIEPMVILGGHEVAVLDDGWTVVTADGTPAAHIEHTVVVTDSGSDVLTDGH